MYRPMNFFSKALKRYHKTADRGDWAREDALRFLAMMPSEMTRQPRLHAPLVNAFRRILNRLRRTLSLQH